MKVYIYVTAKRPYLCYQDYESTDKRKNFKGYKLFDDPSYEKCSCNGKVVASFDLDEAEDLSHKYAGVAKDSHFYEVLLKSNMSVKSLERFCPTNSGLKAYALKMENIHVLKSPFALPDESDVIPWNHILFCESDGECRVGVIVSVSPADALIILNGKKTYIMEHECPKGVKII